MEELYDKVAEQIANCDFLLIGAGAGMSADSGLLVYSEVSETAFFQRNNLTYRDLADPRLLITNPDLFYGWTASCMHKYRNSKPHEGYFILNRWKEEIFAKKSEEITKFQEILRENQIRDVKEGGEAPKNVFVITTNVDGFFKRVGFDDFEICETHGSYSRLQCGGVRRGEGPKFKLFDGPCVNKTWEIPSDFLFNYNEETMIAPPGPPLHSSSSPLSIAYDGPPPSHFNNNKNYNNNNNFNNNNNNNNNNNKDINHNNNNNNIKNNNNNINNINEMNNNNNNNNNKEGEWGRNHPLCPFCGLAARSNVYLFGDHCYVVNDYEEANWMNWRHSLTKLLSSSSPSSSPRLVMLEFGVGMRLPKVRIACERLLSEVPVGSASLIRVNMEFPVNTINSSTINNSNIDIRQSIISLPEKSLVVLKEIDKRLREKYSL